MAQSVSLDIPGAGTQFRLHSHPPCAWEREREEKKRKRKKDGGKIIHHNKSQSDSMREREKIKREREHERGREGRNEKNTGGQRARGNEREN